MPEPARRFSELDGLRGLAALMVALSHYVLAFQPALLGGGPSVAHFSAAVAISRTPAIALFNPELGVAIFFALSGFVLTASAARTQASLPALIVRRWARLALPVLGTSLLIWPLAEWRMFFSVDAAGLAKSDWLAGNYAWLAFEKPDLGVLVWQSLVDLFARSNHFYNTALWTMPTEFRGSVALFAVVALLRWRVADARLRAWLGLGASLAALGLVWNTAYFGFPCGVALFEAGRLPPPMRRAGEVAGGICLGLGVVFGGMPFLIVPPFEDFYGRVFLALAPFIDNPVLLLHRVAAVCLVAAALLFEPMRATLMTTACQRLGRISFMLYLVHVPLLCSLIAWLLPRLALEVGYDAATALLLPVFLVATAAIAAVCTRWIDAPTLRLINRTAGWRATGHSRRRMLPHRNLQEL